MAITQAVNNKANVKKSTTNDLPFSPAQPVINSFSATSTAGQTSITNLGFTVDTVNNPDVFFLFVDGKKLRLGSSNDFVFAAVAADGTSSQVTFTQSLPVNLNIQAYKLGLKPEAQFTMDNRFTQLYANQSAGFQGFVSQTDSLITSTTTTGSPAAGTFYSTIQNRASIADLSQDLKPRMGVERIMVQQVSLSQTEFGPNGESVWVPTNDIFGQIRFVGIGWKNDNSNNGQKINTTSTGDYVEVTFYGTGLNLIMQADANNIDVRASVDGGAEGSNIVPPFSTALLARNYNTNSLFSAVSNLTLGIHTVKLRFNANDAFIFDGCEILNESATVSVAPGIAYISGTKIVAPSAQTFSYNSAVTGTTGGRVLVYLSASGTIGQAFTPAGTSPAYLTSASHTNEDIAREYAFREFGAGRGDDFANAMSASSRIFTLDDAVTTLACTSASTANNGLGEVVFCSTTSAVMTFTFVGTGLDIYEDDATAVGGAIDSHTFVIDGISAGSVTTSVRGIRKIVSGLAHGTHVVRMTRNAGAVNGVGILRFIVYQAKKPTLPAGAMELADYNVLGNYSASTTAGIGNISTGTIRRVNTRDTVLSGSGWTPSTPDNTNFTSGVSVTTGTNGDYVEGTFFGTGINWRTLAPPAVATFTVSLQSITTGGSLLTFNTTNFPTPAGAATAYGNLSFSGSTGVITAAGVQTAGAGFNISGLTLGLYKIRIAKTTGTNMYHDTFDTIAPIQSFKFNIPSDLQNSLSVGSQGISDNRKFTPIKDALSSNKAWAQAIGVASSPTTTSNVAVPVLDMSVTIKTSGGPLDISYSLSSNNNTTGAQNYFQIYVDGVAVGVPKMSAIATGGSTVANTSDSMRVPVAAGVHKVDLTWLTNAGTANCFQTERTLLVKEG